MSPMHQGLRAADEAGAADDTTHGVDLRHLRGFVAVVEEANFTRAAARLSLTQPALSRTIAQLERLLDVVLLHRTKQVVELTSAGAGFLPYARRALVAVDEAVRSAQLQSPHLRVGFTWGAASAYMGPAVRAFERQHPGSRVELHRFDDTLAGLGDGRAHVGFLPSAPDDPRIETMVLAHEPRVAAIPADHPLARRRSLRLRDLQPETLVVNIVSGSTSLDLWKAGQAPESIIEVRNVDEWLEEIAAGRGIGMTPATASRLYTHPQICYRKLLDAPFVPIVLAWPASGRHPLTDDFIEAAERTGIDV
jgi:DNA-binding transcriptional LysR family regulator